MVNYTQRESEIDDLSIESKRAWMEEEEEGGGVRSGG